MRMKKILMMCCLAVLTACSSGGGLENVTNIVNETKNETAQPSAEPTVKPTLEPTPEPDPKRTDLTGFMDDIDTMHEYLPAPESLEGGMHTRWYQDMDNRWGYGEFNNNKLVDDFWITAEGFEIHGLYIGMNCDEAINHLESEGFRKTDEFDDGMRLTDDKLNFQIRYSGSEVSQIGFTRCTPSPWQQQQSGAAGEDYFFPDSLDVLLTESQLYGLSAQQLTYARNEIYARYGYTFKRQDLQEYFNQKSWYKADPAVNADTIGSYVSSTGMANMIMIRDYQKANGLTW